MKDICRYLCLSAIVTGGVLNAAVTKTDAGYVIPVEKSDNIKLLRIQPVTNDIIHVSATADTKFADPESLVAVPVEAMTTSTIKEIKDTVIISTDNVDVYALSSTGEVWFTDKKGNVILEEQKGGGKTFTPITVDNTKGYTIQQVFESPADEAFYGLGQHQSDEFNYKGKNEELFQYNTKVSVPFIVSNKNYGILLDSYSLCRFGSPNDYSQLGKIFTLYNKDGKKGSLTGIYTNKEGQKLTRDEDSVYYENLKSNLKLPQDLPLANANVIFEGEIEPKENGQYDFILYYSGYVTVKIGDEIVVPERWRTAWNPNSYKFNINLKANKKYPIKIEWTPNGNESYCGLRALSPIDEKTRNQHSWWSEMTKQLDYYFINGNNMDEVISGYRTVTGKAPMMPKWAMGYWQSRERYKTTDEIVGALKGFRERQIPIDNIVIDWNYWPIDSWGSHDFDLERFPDPKGMIDTLHALDAKVMISVWPKFYLTTDNFKEFDKNGWIYQQAVKDSLYDWLGYKYSFYDAYDPAARKMFWNQMADKLYPLGIDAWWMDASEPNVRDCTDIDYRKALSGPTALGSSTEFFNAYSLVNAEAIYNGQRELDNDKRVFLLTRSGFSGLQRYSTATWSGDIGTRWEDMKAQISAGLNFAVSGIPYWTMDIGGFCVEDRYVAGQQVWDAQKIENEDYKEWRELNARWYQFGAFAPLFRAHGQYPFREVWEIAPEGHPAYNSIVYYTKLRYNMMPYIYSLAGKVYLDDYTIMRPLIMEFPNDKATTNISDEFMFGDALLVAPVYEYGARNRDIYFPATNGWYDFYTGKFVKGGQTLNIDAPYEQIPLFVRTGAIIPFGPDIQHTQANDNSNVTIYVYKGNDGAFTIYEDQGTNNNYEKGEYSTIPLTYNEATSTLTIGERKGSYEGMPATRNFEIVVVSQENPIGYDVNRKGKKVKYNGKTQKIKL